MSKALGLLAEGILLSAILTGFAALGWNQLGGADAVGLPHVGFVAIYGLLSAAQVAAYSVGAGLKSGALRSVEVNGER